VHIKIITKTIRIRRRRERGRESNKKTTATVSKFLLGIVQKSAFFMPPNDMCVL
jgi:hypothetical protein